MFVCVCLCPAPVSCSADKQAFKHNFIHYISSGFPIKERVVGLHREEQGGRDVGLMGHVSS